ncbi:hypothetical protein [Streptomyces sp. VRA16 Mangrove soil]|uniref:hypothetical protein n=1 Tax=Streptomyces sp. VRA16 Mangrove soil TaxID=2817434 RepID=UPI001A9FFA55|nr:hypothetical protein [Streptomyces sp. VRA16 Mangrove soil]MBO1331291.1 hypothetical protein [Streptomyces sp. VRA16 Mangrove soil]
MRRGTSFATDLGEIQLLPGKLMGPGQRITLVGDGKAGKSLFPQEWVGRRSPSRSCTSMRRTGRSKSGNGS